MGSVLRRRRADAMAFLWSTLAAIVMHAEAVSANLVISEFLAANKGGLKDEDGEYSDWLEVHNTGGAAVNLVGMSLTDDVEVPAQWTFPSVNIGPDAYLVVFCSGKDKTGSELHTNFGLKAGGEYLGLFDADGSVLSEYAPEYPPQLDDRSYGIDSNGDIRYFSGPSPGSANGVGDVPAASSAVASADRGFYTNSFTVELSTTQAGGQVRYTLDGSEPTSSNGSVYTSPISVTTTTILRAATFANDVEPSPTSTYTYIFLEDVIQQPASIPGFPNGVSRSTGSKGNVPLDMEMDPQVVAAYGDEILSSMTDIPTVSLVAAIDVIFGDDGFYFNENEEKVSIEILHADPADNDQIDVGVEAHSHDRLKRSLRLNFRKEYGKREWSTNIFEDYAPLNGDSAKKKKRTLILRGGNNRCWARSWNPDATTYTEDEFYRSTFVTINDGVGSHGTFVHFYLNGVYWGVYNLVERPDDEFAASYLDGDDDDWFFTNHGGAGSADSTRWDYLKGDLAEKNMANAKNYEEMKQYLDVQSFADYLLTSFYIGLTDWPKNNWYVILRNDSSDLGPTPAQFQPWDGEWSFDRRQGGGVDGAALTSQFINCDDTSTVIVKLFCSLKASDDFMNLFSSRAALHTAPGGALSTEAALARWDTLNSFIESAIVGESARWGDSLVGLGGSKYDVTRTRDGDWQNEVDLLRNLLQGNSEQLIDALKDAGLYTPPTPISAPVSVPTPFLPPTDAPVAIPTTDAPIESTTDASVVDGGVPTTSPVDPPVAGPMAAPVSTPTDSSIVTTTDAPVPVTPPTSTSGAIPWVETFAQADGTTESAGATAWTAMRETGSFYVQGGSLVLTGFGPEGVLTTSAIDISSAPVDITLDLYSNGPLELNQDYVRLYAIVDGNKLLLGEKKGMLDEGTSIAGTDIKGSSLIVEVRMYVSYAAETYLLDGLSIVPSGSAPVAFPVSPPIIMPVTPPMAPSGMSFTLVNAATNVEIGPLLTGKAFSLGSVGTELNVVANPSSPVGSVKFWRNGSLVRNENKKPYAMVGDIGSDYNSWTPEVGQYTIVATAYSEAGSAGFIVESGSVSFTIVE